VVLLETSWKEITKIKAEGEKVRIVAKIDHFESKNLFTVFFRTLGVVHLSYLDNGKTKGETGSNNPKT